MDDEEAELEEGESEIGETAAEVPGRVASTRTLVDIPVIPFEPPTTGSGHDIGEKQGKLRTAILERVSQNELAKFKEALKGHLVTITLGFFLWKGSTKTTNTRAVKDLDNLMKIIFDVLGRVSKDWVCWKRTATSARSTRRKSWSRIRPRKDSGS